MVYLRTIYEKLASAFTEELSVLYNQRVDEISPNIRYCAYNIGKEASCVRLYLFLGVKLKYIKCMYKTLTGAEEM